MNLSRRELLAAGAASAASALPALPNTTEQSTQSKRAVPPAAQTLPASYLPIRDYLAREARRITDKRARRFEHWRNGDDMRQSRRIAIAVSVLATIVTVQVSAMYFFPETREVPVARLVANLERDLKADPRNIELQINLARLHGMAYALKTEVVAAAPRAGDREEPY